MAKKKKLTKSMLKEFNPSELKAIAIRILGIAVTVAYSSNTAKLLDLVFDGLTTNLDVNLTSKYLDEVDKISVLRDEFKKRLILIIKFCTEQIDSLDFEETGETDDKVPVIEHTTDNNSRTSSEEVLQVKEEIEELVESHLEEIVDKDPLPAEEEVLNTIPDNYVEKVTIEELRTILIEEELALIASELLSLGHRVKTVINYLITSKAKNESK